MGVDDGEEATEAEPLGEGANRGVEAGERVGRRKVGDAVVDDSVGFALEHGEREHGANCPSGRRATMWVSGSLAVRRVAMRRARGLISTPVRRAAGRRRRSERSSSPVEQPNERISASRGRWRARPEKSSG